MEEGTLLCEIREILTSIRDSSKTRPDIDSIVQLSANNPLIVDYKNRHHIYIWSAIALTLSLEDLGTLMISANAWTNISFSSGMRLYAIGQNSLAPVLVRCKDSDVEQQILSATTFSVGGAIAPYTGNPTQTEAASSDTQFKWGILGTTIVNHISLQNNTTVNVYYAFDALTTGSANSIYILAPGQLAIWDRQCTVLHFQTASQQPINNGTTACIVTEGFV